MLHHLKTQTEAQSLTEILRAGSDHSELYRERGPVEERVATLQMVLEGCVLRQRFMADGRLQTVAVYYRDDVVNLMGYVGSDRRNRDDLVALQGSVIGYVADATVREMRALAPAGRDGMSLLLYRELGIAQERLVCLGQRSALEHAAHFLCETLVRCAKPAADYRTARCSLNMTQDMLSSVLGISAVHVNRTLQELRRLKLADLVHRELIVHDFEGLAKLGEFDQGYLSPI